MVDDAAVSGRVGTVFFFELVGERCGVFFEEMARYDDYFDNHAFEQGG